TVRASWRNSTCTRRPAWSATRSATASSTHSNTGISPRGSPDISDLLHARAAGYVREAFLESKPLAGPLGTAQLLRSSSVGFLRGRTMALRVLVAEDSPLVQESIRD